MLYHCPVPAVREDRARRILQEFEKSIGVLHRYHLVVLAVDDECAGLDPSDLRLLVIQPAALLDPAHRRRVTGARLGANGQLVPVAQHIFAGREVRMGQGGHDFSHSFHCKVVVQDGRHSARHGVAQSGAAHQHDIRQQIGTPHGDSQRGASAHGVADQIDLAIAQGIDQGEQLFGTGVLCVREGRRVRRIGGSKAHHVVSDGSIGWSE